MLRIAVGDETVRQPASFDDASVFGLRVKRAENSSSTVRRPSASHGEGASISAHFAVASDAPGLSNHTERV